MTEIYTKITSRAGQAEKRAINSVKVFIDALSNSSVLQLNDFGDFFEEAERLVATEYRASTGALSNVRGSWYEWLIAIGSIEYAVRNPTAHRIVQLPNVSSYDAGMLYNEEHYAYISDLKEKVLEAANVSLITSNPDFVIMSSNIEIQYPDIASRVKTAADIRMITELYLQAEHRCEFDDIIGYIGVKTSLRPDRRLQLPHEGSLLKALYRHIQTRDWMLDAKGIKYYCISIKFSDADEKALKTVATHSLVTVSSKPESAVDELFKVNSGAELLAALDAINE